MEYPGRIIQADDPDTAVVDAVRQRLNARGYHADAVDGFDAPTAFTAAVRYFQSTHVDSSGRPLKVDGAVGPNTWAALFGASSIATTVPAKALAIAEGQIGVLESPPGSNAGPDVMRYLDSVGCPPGSSWCMAFVHWCLLAASKPGPCPAPSSGGVLDVYNRTRASAPHRIIMKAEALANPGLLQPGCVFIMDHGGGKGHTGFVKSVKGAALTTIEGNTNTNASREGVGVFELTRRSVTDEELVAFIDFGR